MTFVKLKLKPIKESGLFELNIKAAGSGIKQFLKMMMTIQKLQVMKT
jgi:hypothetical protein